LIFEKRVGEYQKAGVVKDKDDNGEGQKISFDASF